MLPTVPLTPQFTNDIAGEATLMENTLCLSEMRCENDRPFDTCKKKYIYDYKSREIKGFELGPPINWQNYRFWNFCLIL